MKLHTPIRVWYDKIAGREYALTSVQHLLSVRSQGWGERPEVYGGGGHNGHDWPLKTGTPVYAMHDGECVEKLDKNADGTFKGYGRYAQLTGSGVKSYSCHLDSVLPGPKKAGDIVGYSDNTGFSTGPHLHITLKLLDENGNVLNRNNGFDGAVDFSPWLVWYNEDMDKELLARLVEKIYKSWVLKDPAGVEYWQNLVKENPATLENLLDQRIADIKEVTQ